MVDGTQAEFLGELDAERFARGAFGHVGREDDDGGTPFLVEGHLLADADEAPVLQSLVRRVAARREDDERA